MRIIAETERLIIRHLEVTDAAFALELVNTPGWLQNIGDRNVHNLEQAKQYLLNGPIKSYQVNGFGIWLLELKEEQTRVGMCGIIKRDGLDLPDLGYALLPTYQGKGYVTEAATAVLKYTKEVLQIPQILAITNLDNLPSIKVLEKQGFIFEKTYTLPGETTVLRLFRWTAEN